MELIVGIRFRWKESQFVTDFHKYLFCDFYNFTPIISLLDIARGGLRNEKQETTEPFHKSERAQLKKLFK